MVCVWSGGGDVVVVLVEWGGFGGDLMPLR